MKNHYLSKVRSFLWPVTRADLPKFIPMFLICCLLCFTYFLLRTTKDTLVVTAPQSGAEALPFIKVWAVLPVIFLMTFIFTRFSNKLSRKHVFYAVMSFYVAYFALFTFVLYPLRDSLHPHAFADRMQEALPSGFSGLIAMIRNWTYTSFYVMTETWSAIVIYVLFWGFTHDVTSVTDAKRFYGLFAIGTTVSISLAGLTAPILSSLPFNPKIPFGTNGWDQSVLFINLIVIVSALLCMGLFWWVNRRGLGYTKEQETAHKEMPVKLGIRENFSYLKKSKYLSLIAALVLSYNVVINLIEVVWTDRVKLLYPTPSEFNAYMGGVVSWMGALATVISLFISGNFIRKFGWTTSALIPPVIALITGALFFACLLAPASILGGICSLLGTTPLALAVFFGSMQNCTLRGTKYSLIDATKELAFVPISPESRLKGKAAIDGIGSRLGRSGASLFYQFLFIIFGSISASTPVVCVVLLGAIGIWIASVRALGSQFNEITAS